MTTKERYIEELRMQLMFVDDVRDYEEIMETITYLEDADYAAASTELAKTQIMQQAATAVLAQANTSQQSVLKLLGG